MFAAACDATLALLPPVAGTPMHLALLAGGGVAFIGGAAVYLAAGLGANPRDGVMLALVRRYRLRLAWVRVVFDVVAVAAGALLAGVSAAAHHGLIGAGSVLLALVTGPAIATLLPHLTRASHLNGAQPSHWSPPSPGEVTPAPPT